MSLTSFNLAELRAFAEEYGVDLTGVKGKSNIIAALEESGVDYNYIVSQQEVIAATEPVAVDPRPAKPEVSREDAVLIKMERQNLIFETHGVRFTREHPFVAVDPETAQEIFDTEEGFRPATPRELQDYYR